MTANTSVPQADTQTIECANCGANFVGAFCPACGQKADTGRLSLKTMAANLFRAIYDMDSKVWRTVIDLTRNPGQVALDYVAGGRVRYINPVKYFITVYAISIALSVATGELDQNLQYTQQEAGLENIDADRRAAVEERVALVNDMLRNRMDLLTFLMVPFIAVFLRIHNFRAGKNLAETLSFQCYMWGHFGLLSIPLIPTLYLSPTFNFWIKNVVMVVIIYYGMKVFYNRGWLRSLLSFAFAIVYSLVAALLAMNVLVGLRHIGVL